MPEIVGGTENQSKQGASRYLIFNQFEGMDTQSSRIDLPVEKQAWLENLQPVAKNVLRGVPAPAGTIYTLTGETVVRTFSSIIINGTEYVIAFCASGAAYAATVAFNGYDQPIIGSSVVFIAPAGTFSATGGDVVEWNAKRILIADSIAGYSTWDGSLFVRQGNASPNIAVTNGGFGYTNGATAQIIIVRTTFTVTAPGAGYVNGATVAITGGSGTGMTAVALIIGGKLVAVTQTSPGQGYLPGDTLTVTITPVSGGAGATATATVAAAPGVAPTASVQVSQGIVTGLTLTGAGSGLVAADGLTVIITGIGGAGSGATAIAHPWPFISPFPTTLAVAFGRVWLAVNRTLIVTGTGSLQSGEAYDDFNLADASVTTTLQDADLVQQITALRYLNNYLYILGDNSVKSIGGITVINSVTAFSIITLTSDQGTVFPNSVISFNRLILFANTVGVHAVFGASVEKISGPMDGIFRLADFSQPLQAAVNDLNNLHTYLLLIRYRDPLAPGERSLILGYTDRKWFVMNQSNTLASICTAVINGVTTTFGSSGNDLTQLLQNKSAGVSFKISTSLSSHGDPINSKRFIRAGLGQTSDACPDIDLIAESAELPQVETNFKAGSRPLIFVNNNGQIITFINNSGQTVNFVANGFTANWSGTFSQKGRWIGLTATGTINTEQIHILWIEYQPDVPVAFVPCIPQPVIPPPVSNPITPTPIVPPFVNVPALWFAGQSCELMSWPLTASGTNPAPTIDLTGPLTTLTGPQGNLQSNTVAADVDTINGRQYCLTQSHGAGGWTINIPVFAHGATGNVAPVVNITPMNAQFVNQGVELNNGGLCLDAAKNIYVAFPLGLNTLQIWKIAAGSAGNVTATLIATDTTVTVTSLCYDAVNNLIWASCFGAAPFRSSARAYTTAGVLQTTITTTAQNLAGQVFIGPTGQIVLSGIDAAAATNSLTQVFPVGSSGAAAASQTIKITAAQGPVVPCGAMDATGILYLGPIFDAMNNENINVYAAGATGTNPATLRTFNSTLFKLMADATPTNIQQILVR